VTPLEILSGQFRELDLPHERPRDAPLLCGVYLLAAADEIVYIGSSTDIIVRAWNHQRSKSFDRLLWVWLPSAVHPYYEGAFIRAIRPPLNRSAPVDARYDAEILDGFGLEPCLEWRSPTAPAPVELPDIASRLARWRRSRRITQAELGSRVGVSRAAVSYWETGTTTPTVENIQRVVAALDLSMFDFYSDVAQ
jgi:DNA-binding XRE family transcriptional regulator